MRLLYAYFKELPREEAPFLRIPLHRVLKLSLGQGDAQEEVITLAAEELADPHVSSC